METFLTHSSLRNVWNHNRNCRICSLFVIHTLHLPSIIPTLPKVISHPTVARATKLNYMVARSNADKEWNFPSSLYYSIVNTVPYQVSAMHSQPCTQHSYCIHTRQFQRQTKQGSFLFAARPSLGPTQPLIQCFSGVKAAGPWS